jgi:hypothetical protein
MSPRWCAPVACSAAALVAMLASPPVAYTQPGLGRCTEPIVSGADAEGRASPVHPAKLREQYAEAIVARDWGTAVTGYTGTVELTLAAMPAPSPAFVVLRDSILSAQRVARLEMLEWIAKPPRERQGVLSGDVVNQFRPLLVPGGALAVLQSSTRFRGVPIDTTTMRADEVQAVCWSSWSLYRLAGAVNYETVPTALARVEAQTQRWERYRTRGPLQLPHELVVNRLLRHLKDRGPAAPFTPPRWDLVALHPFAGVELRRAGSGLARSETVALEAAGLTVWLADWKRFVGASYVVSSTATGDVGHGALLRLSGLATAGVVQRRDAAGMRSTLLLVQLDALRLLANDNNAKRALGLLGVSGEALYGREPRR